MRSLLSKECQLVRLEKTTSFFAICFSSYCSYSRLFYLFIQVNSMKSKKQSQAKSCHAQTSSRKAILVGRGNWEGQSGWNAWWSGGSLIRVGICFTNCEVTLLAYAHLVKHPPYWGESEWRGGTWGQAAWTALPSALFWFWFQALIRLRFL